MAKESGATLAQELDPAWIEDFAKRWEAAWNSHAQARLLELMTDDIVYDDSGSPATMRGHGDVRSFLDSVWRAFPDLRFEMIEGPYIVPGQPKAAFYWSGSATHTGLLDPPALRRPATASSSRAPTCTSTATGASAGFGSCST